MNKTPITPWPCSKHIGFDQARLIHTPSQLLFCAGQTSVDDKGMPLFANDMAGQISQVFRNIKTILDLSGFQITDIDRLSVFTTDIEATLQNFDKITGPFAPKPAAPPITLLEVNRLARVELVIEIEATASR